MTWQEVYDEANARYYYYNNVTGDTSWDPPPGYGAETVAPVVAPATSAATSPWQQLYDDSSGRHYFYNTATGDTSWEQPEGYVDPSTTAVESAAAVTKETVAPGGLPEGWMEVTDPSSGTVYYYNQLTGDTSWDAPVSVPQTVVEDTAAASNATSQVRWLELVDPASGATYYQHPETYETRWDSPYGDAGPPSESEGQPLESSEAGASSSGSAGSSATGNKVTDGMSLYSSMNLTLPSYSVNDGTGAAVGNDQGTSASSGKSSKRNAYVFAPDEFAAEFISLGNKASSNNAAKQGSKLGFNDDGDDEDFDEDNDGGRGTGSGIGHGMTIGETMALLNDYVEWNDINQSSSLSEQLLHHIPFSLLSSPKLLSALTRKLSAFTMMKFAENYFQFDRRGNQMLANTLDKLISFQTEPLKTSLTTLPSALAMEAITCFKEIQFFMLSAESIVIGMSKSGNSHQNSHLLDIALNLIQKLIIAPVEFHEEIYLQIMKQVKRNPSIESTELGWQLMLMLLSSIPPSKKILPFLLYFCSQNVESLQDEAKKFAAFSLKICLKSALAEIRKELPTRKEIQAVLLGEQVEVKVQVIDGQILTLMVDSFTTIKTFESTIAETLQVSIENYPIFALFEYREGKEKLLSTSDRVLDVVSTWEKGSSTDGQSQQQQQQGHQPGHSHSGTFVSQIYNDFELTLHSRDFFFYKVHIYYFPANLEGDLVTKRLLYFQGVQDIVSAYYPHTLQDGLMLAALQLHISHGDFVVGKEIKEFRSTSLLKRTLSATWLERDDIARTEMESRMLSLYKKLIGVPKEVAMTMFLSYASTWKLYGAKYYVVKGQLDNTGNFTHDLVIALTPRSVIIIDVSTNSFLADYNYDQIYSWGHSFDSFVLVIGSKSTQVKSYFRTSQGKEIEEMLKIYANQNGGDKDALNSSMISIQQ